MALSVLAYIVNHLLTGGVSSISFCFFLQSAIFKILPPFLHFQKYTFFWQVKGNLFLLFYPTIMTKYWIKSIFSTQNFWHKMGSSVAFKFKTTTVSLAHKSLSPSEKNRKQVVNNFSETCVNLFLSYEKVYNTEIKKVHTTLKNVLCSYRLGQISLSLSLISPALKLLSTNCSNMKYARGTSMLISAMSM